MCKRALEAFTSVIRASECTIIFAVIPLIALLCRCWASLHWKCAESTMHDIADPRLCVHMHEAAVGAAQSTVVRYSRHQSVSRDKKVTEKSDTRG